MKLLTVKLFKKLLHFAQKWTPEDITEQLLNNVANEPKFQVGDITSNTL